MNIENILLLEMQDNNFLLQIVSIFITYNLKLLTHTSYFWSSGSDGRLPSSRKCGE